jgi:uncharacterized membrane protein YkoI
MRAYILTVAVLTAFGWSTAEAQGLRETVSHCAGAAGPAGMGQTVERIEMISIAMPPALPGAPKGTPFLQFAIGNPDSTSWEVTCNGATGAVVDVEREVSSAQDPLFQRNAKISEADARKAALQARPGKIVAVQYEVGADGTPQYEFDLHPASGEAGMLVEVNAITGQVAKVWVRAYALQSE